VTFCSTSTRTLTLGNSCQGGVMGAANATLTFMAGGDAAAVKEAETVLLHMGKRVVHCGASGAGQVAKLCNNLILGITMGAVCEALFLKP